MDKEFERLAKNAEVRFLSNLGVKQEDIARLTNLSHKAVNYRMTALNYFKNRFKKEHVEKYHNRS